MRETVPDWLLARADQVISSDLTAEDLRQRLVDGKIYQKQRIPAALENFFTEEHLTTLRELALCEVATSVDRVREDFARGDARQPSPRPRAADLLLVATASRPPRTAALLRQSGRSWWHRFRHGSVVERLIDNRRGSDVQIVSFDDPSPPR